MEVVMNVNSNIGSIQYGDSLPIKPLQQGESKEAFFSRASEGIQQGHTFRPASVQEFNSICQLANEILTNSDATSELRSKALLVLNHTIEQIENMPPKEGEIYNQLIESLMKKSQEAEDKDWVRLEEGGMTKDEIEQTHKEKAAQKARKDLEAKRESLFKSCAEQLVTIGNKFLNQMNDYPRLDKLCEVRFEEITEFENTFANELKTNEKARNTLQNIKETIKETRAAFKNVTDQYLFTGTQKRSEHGWVQEIQLDPKTKTETLEKMDSAMTSALHTYALRSDLLLKTLPHIRTLTSGAISWDDDMKTEGFEKAFKRLTS